MRKDLDFLYQKAMRSQDVEFMNEVWNFLYDENRVDDMDSLTDRILFMLEYPLEYPSKFSFLIGDSQMGENWYRNRK